MKLICFTYAGGNALFYNKIKNELFPEVELVAIEYAGHGNRHREPFYSDFSELADDMFTQIGNILSEHEPYAIMGYSMGSISAIEVLRKEIMANKRLPVHVFLAAHEPCTQGNLVDFNNEDMDAFVKQRTINFGAVPEKLIHNESFWRTYLPMYRADYSIIGKYKFENLKIKFDVPATIFYSESDTKYDIMEQWEKYFSKSCDFVEYTGNHFFINEHFEEMAQEIKNRLVV